MRVLLASGCLAVTLLSAASYAQIDVGSGLVGGRDDGMRFFVGRRCTAAEGEKEQNEKGTHHPLKRASGSPVDPGRLVFGRI